MDGLIIIPESISGGIGKEGQLYNDILKDEQIDMVGWIIIPESKSGGIGKEGLDR